jgi:integrase
MVRASAGHASPDIHPGSGREDTGCASPVPVAWSVSCCTTSTTSSSSELERYVIPRIGAVRLQALTPAHLERLYDDLERDGRKNGGPLAAKTVVGVTTTLRRSLTDAVRRGRLKRNPSDAVKAPTAMKAQTEWWSVDQLRAFLLHVRDDEHYATWLLFATTGARLGEVAGLTWDDIDLDAGRMRVNWGLGHVGHQLTWKARPKTEAGARVMALDPATVTALREHRRRQNETRLLVGPEWQSTFTDWQGLSRSGLLWTFGGRRAHPPEDNQQPVPGARCRRQAPAHPAT